MPRFLLFVIVCLLSTSGPADAACMAPEGVQGEIVYNVDHNLFQGCTSTGWRSLSGAPGAKGQDAQQFWSKNEPDIYFSSGDVGIGTDAPSSALQVIGTVTATSFSGSGSAITGLDATNIAAGTVATVRLGTGTADSTTFLRGDGTWTTTPSGADNLGNHIATTLLRSDTHNTDDLGTSAIRWKDGWFAGTVTAATLSGAHSGSGASLSALDASQLTTGTVAVARIGTGTKNTTTFYRGDGTFSNTLGGSFTATAYYQSSDRELKAAIEPIADPFALLNGIEGKHFRWKNSDKGAYGVIAQDVAAVMPDAVSENDEGYMTVEYGQLLAPLIEAVKQLKDEVAALRADNDNLREENRILKEDAP